MCELHYTFNVVQMHLVTYRFSILRYSPQHLCWKIAVIF